MTRVVTLKRGTYCTGQSGAIDDVLRQTEHRMRSAHATNLRYPYNLVGYSPVPAAFGDYLVNPYVGSHYASHACDLEREAVWLMDLWQYDELSRSCGGAEVEEWAECRGELLARSFAIRQSHSAFRGSCGG